MTPLPTGLLALPPPGDATLRSLTRKVRLLALRCLLELAPERVGSELRRPLAALQSGLMRVARGANKKGLVRAVGAIDVLAPTLVLEAGMSDASELLRTLVPHLLCGLATGGLVESILWDAVVDLLVDPPRGRVMRFEPPALGLLVDPSGVEIRVATGERFTLGEAEEAPSLRSEGALHPIAGDIQLASVDTNPIASMEAHPDKSGNRLDLAGRDADTWCRALGEALDLIEVALPELRAEIAAHLQRVVPVGYHEQRHFSASYREAPGLIYLSLHPSALTLAEAIVHETQHGKLNALSWFDAILVNGQDTWTESPVRPDLRPLLGVLLAVHAFVPVAALHHRLRELRHPAVQGAEARAEEVRRTNERGLQTLRELARPTEIGARVIAALEDLHAVVSP